LLKGDRVQLSNLGATSSVNSVVQQLYNLPLVKKFFLNTVFPDESLAAFHVIFNHIEHTMRNVIDMNIFQSM
jgi:hypothetical protein